MNSAEMWSCCFRRQKKKRPQEAELGDSRGSSSQQSITAEEDTDYTLSASAPPEPPNKKTNKSWQSLFQKKTKKPKSPVEQELPVVQEAPPTRSTAEETSVRPDTIDCADDGEDVQEASVWPDAPPSFTPQKKKEPWWRRAKARVQKAWSWCDAPLSAAPDNKQKGWWCRPFSHSEKLSVEHQPETAERQSAHPEGPMLKHLIASGQGGSLWCDSSHISVMASAAASVESLLNEELLCLGLPNLGQTCYMNSTLQGLLTLSPFMKEVTDQQPVWSAHHQHPELFRGFVDVGLCRLKDDEVMKWNILEGFKMMVAECNSDFDDDSQKDAHEFLCCMLSGMASLSFHLQATAVGLGLSYTCPVDAHKMMSRRTCKGCGSQSTRYEDFINLSLDLTHVRSVSQCLQKYLQESKLEFTCECKSQESSQKWSFLTLPTVLVLQLQRFRFTPSFRLMKVTSPIRLSQELLLSLEASSSKRASTRYSLVSVVSHLGSKADSGHYICDGAYRQQRADTDRWLTYNDQEVTETTGQAVCHHRRASAYLLFYEKQQKKKMSSSRSCAEQNQ